MDVYSSNTNTGRDTEPDYQVYRKGSGLIC